VLLYPLLQEYLILSGSLPLPEKGLLTIDSEPAYLRKTDSTIVAPTNDILFVPLEMQEPEINNLVSFLSRRLNISFEQAKDLLKKENTSDVVLTEMRDLIKWPGSDGGRTKNSRSANTTTADVFNNYLPSFTAEKIMRQPVSQPVIQPELSVPEEVVNEEVLQEEGVVPKDYWWVWALVILAISIVLILFRYSS
jgi:hypothetical protein